MEPVANPVVPSTTPPGGVIIPTTVQAPKRGPAIVGPVVARLHLQRGAGRNLRRHVQRTVVRVGVLMLADLASFYLMRALIRAVRDQALVGTELAAAVERVMPRGILNGWQYAAALLLSLLVLGCYGAGDQRRDPRRLFGAVALATALPLWMTVWTRGFDMVLVQYALTTTLVWLGLLADRLTVDRLVAAVAPPERQAATAVLVGSPADVERARQSPALGSRGDFRVLGFVDVADLSAREALGSLCDFPSLLARSGAETVVVCSPLHESDLASVVDTSLTAGCHILMVPPPMAQASLDLKVVWRKGSPLMELTAPSLQGWQIVLKRGLDLGLAAVGLVVAAPVMLVIAALVKLDSSGPIFFRQTRVGQGGRQFRIFKFRTMREGAEQQLADLRAQSIYSDPRLFKVPDDPRITRIGRFLRQSSLDELPQLFNVVQGHMSLVGPRPPLPNEVQLYERHHYARFDVRPGITGPWQVSGRNDIRDFEQVVALETNYIRNWSLWRDIAILAQTSWVVLRMRGAH